jgi:hypothetical protein
VQLDEETVYDSRDARQNASGGSVVSRRVPLRVAAKRMFNPRVPKVGESFWKGTALYKSRPEQLGNAPPRPAAGAATHSM